MAASLGGGREEVSDSAASLAKYPGLVVPEVEKHMDIVRDCPPD